MNKVKSFRNALWWEELANLERLYIYRSDHLFTRDTEPSEWINLLYFSKFKNFFEIKPEKRDSNSELKIPRVEWDKFIESWENEIIESVWETIN